MKIRIITLTLIVSLMFGACAMAQDKNDQKADAGPGTVTAKKIESKPKPKVTSQKADMDKVSYCIGVDIGRSFMEQMIDIKIEALVKGITDAIKDQKLAMTDKEMQAVMKKFQTEMQTMMLKKVTVEKEKKMKDGAAFLEANKKKEGVVTLPSGLQYKVIKEGTGATPKATDRVSTNYRGTLIDGKEFDSSYKRGKPAQFAVRGVIKGWTEALQLMKEGAKWELYIPADLAYGDRVSRDIPAGSTLIFEIELIKIVKK
ncbi:MAG: FKBP-type peptidyl-prolyl cis-trans isomerase [Anaerohalosphaera sp.]|nr:FKBP-type peptidyl-prolyl cis-trans isomerase [Anaerohalosphaera sp.]